MTDPLTSGVSKFSGEKTLGGIIVVLGIRAHFISIILISFFATNSWAKTPNSCIGLFTFEAVNDNQPQQAPKRPQLERMDEAAKALVEQHNLGNQLRGKLTEWNRLLGFLGVEQIKLMMLPENIVNSAYSPVENTIRLGSLIEKGQTPRAREAVMAHEFGHAVFNHNFAFAMGNKIVSTREVADLAKKNKDWLEANKKEVQELQTEIAEIEATLKVAQEVQALDTIRDLTAMLKPKEARLNEMAKDILFYNRLHDILIAYDELFADSLPALIWKDAHIMRDTLENLPIHFLAQLRHELLYRGRNRDTNAPRDFSVTSFKNWKHEIADAYTLLDPVRGVLWKLYMENLPKEEIPLYLKTYLEAVSAHVSIRLNMKENVSIKNQKVDGTILNQDFLRIFIAVAQQNGLQIRKSPKHTEKHPIEEGLPIP